MTRNRLLKINELARLCLDYVPDPKYQHDRPIAICLQLAIRAAREGNFGVGALLADNRGKTILRARNRVFHPYLRSDRHAEMEVITRFEISSKGARSLEFYTLYSSLEPCPMCLTRVLISGVGTTFYAAPNKAGGMASLFHHLPDTLQKYAEQKTIQEADCSPLLRSIAWQVFEVNITSDSKRLSSTRDILKIH